MLKKITPVHFILFFVFIVCVLLIVKCVRPDIAQPRRIAAAQPEEESLAAEAERVMPNDTIGLQSLHVDSLLMRARRPYLLLNEKGEPVKNRVTSVRRFEDAFPDLNDVQLATAQRLGLPDAIENRDEAVHKMRELVYVGDCPFYTIKPLHHSIAYLVPRAARLLEEIGRSFMDSLATKGYPLHKMTVTSILRTKEDVRRLRNVNPKCFGAKLPSVRHYFRYFLQPFPARARPRCARAAANVGRDAQIHFGGGAGRPKGNGNVLCEIRI